MGKKMTAKDLEMLERLYTFAQLADIIAEVTSDETEKTKDI